MVAPARAGWVARSAAASSLAAALDALPTTPSRLALLQVGLGPVLAGASGAGECGSLGLNPSLVADAAACVQRASGRAAGTSASALPPARWTAALGHELLAHAWRKGLALSSTTKDGPADRSDAAAAPWA